MQRNTVDIIFKRSTKNTLTFPQFLKSLVIVAEEYQKQLTTFYEANAMNLRRKSNPTGLSVKGVLIKEIL